MINEQKETLILTKEGKKIIKKELEKLIAFDRPNVIAEIKTAREQGDLSENAEFDAAREKQGQIEARILEIENILVNSKIIITSKNENIVHIGSLVKISFNNSSSSQEFTIVGSIEADSLNGKISNMSPVAKAILGKKVGDKVIVENTIKHQVVKILSIKNHS